MDTVSHSMQERFLRLARAAPTRLALLYVVLSYLYLSGFFFRGAFTHGPLQNVAASAMALSDDAGAVCLHRARH
jgi:hypothetical protein